MNQPALILLLLLTFGPTTRAGALEPATACDDAAAWAERGWGVPPAIVSAIGQVESGRADPRTGRVSPWPWTVNSGGHGYFFASRTAAIGFVRGAWARGERRIDVGCFQVDLFYHPVAFNSLEQAFDPFANADYAARTLTVLHGLTGSWAAAVADYHSSLPAEGEDYRRKVARQLRLAASDTGPARSHADGALAEPIAVTDRFAVMMSATAHAIAVIQPARSSTPVKEPR